MWFTAWVMGTSSPMPLLTPTPSGPGCRLSGSSVNSWPVCLMSQPMSSTDVAYRSARPLDTASSAAASDG